MATSTPRNRAKVGSAGKAAAMTRAIDHCSTIHHTAVPSPTAAATPKAQIAAAMPSDSGEALARVPTVADIVTPTSASSIGAKAKEESRWNSPNPTENAPAVATSAAKGWPTTNPQTRIMTVAGTQHAAAPGWSSSHCSLMTSPVAAIISRCGETSSGSSIGNGVPMAMWPAIRRVRFILR